MRLFLLLILSLLLNSCKNLGNNYKDLENAQVTFYYSFNYCEDNYRVEYSSVSIDDSDFNELKRLLITAKHFQECWPCKPATSSLYNLSFHFEETVKNAYIIEHLYPFNSEPDEGEYLYYDGKYYEISGGSTIEILDQYISRVKETQVITSDTCPRGIDILRIPSEN